ERDAEDAYYEMHGRRVYGHALNIQWAKNAPSRSWRSPRSPERGDRTNGEERMAEDRRSRSISQSRGETKRRDSRSSSRPREEARERTERSPRDRSPSPNGHPASHSQSVSPAPHRSQSRSPQRD
ncbi:917_t:CDS:2, partial [Dentiscutata heterogama]